MKRRTGLFLMAGFLLVLAAAVWGQSRKYYFNEVGYIFPAAQGSAGNVLTNDGSGNLSWAAVPTSEGLWSGAVIMSTTGCPTGWTRLSAADNRVLRGASSAGATGGADTHTHTMSGTSGSQSVSISGDTDTSSVSISGATGSTSISHTHSLTTTTTYVGAGGYEVIQSASADSTDPAHAHTSGSLAGGSHSHSSGTLGASSHSHAAGSLSPATVSNLPAYYAVILCAKN
jgi:hypothetical protein